MTGLPNKLYSRCRTALLKCSEFDSNASLRAVFVISELAPFYSKLPEADSKSSRVDVCLAYLTDKHLSDGQAALALLLAALRDRQPEGDALRDELGAVCLEAERGSYAQTDRGDGVRRIEQQRKLSAVGWPKMRHPSLKEFRSWLWGE